MKDITYVTLGITIKDGRRTCTRCGAEAINDKEITIAYVCVGCDHDPVYCICQEKGD